MYKYLYYAKLAFIETTAYRFTMLMSLLLNPVAVAVQYFIWKSLLSAQSTIAGYNLPEVMQYFVLAMMIGNFIYTGIIHNFTHLVLRGHLTRDILRPTDLYTYMTFEVLGHRFMALFVEVLPFGAIMALILGVHILIPAQPLLFILSILLALWINISWTYLLGTLTFWTKQTHGIRMINFASYLLLAGLAFPLGIYPQAMQNAVSALPFIHMIYAPAQIFIGEMQFGLLQTATQAVLYSAAWAVGLFLLAKALEKLAVKQYEGVGQ